MPDGKLRFRDSDKEMAGTVGGGKLGSSIRLVLCLAFFIVVCGMLSVEKVPPAAVSDPAPVITVSTRQNENLAQVTIRDNGPVSERK